MLTVYTIYENPSDYPDGYVVRPWTIEPNDLVPGEAQYVGTLDEARATVPAGSFRLAREFHDDPVIVETWV